MRMKKIPDKYRERKNNGVITDSGRRRKNRGERIMQNRKVSVGTSFVIVMLNS